MKSKSFILEDLMWLEAKIASIKNYINDNPLETLRDRIVTVDAGKSQKQQIAATIEVQFRTFTAVLKELPPLLEAVEKLREKNQAEDIKIKGDYEMPGLMKTKFQPK